VDARKTDDRVDNTAEAYPKGTAPLEAQIAEWKKLHISFDEQAEREGRMADALASANAEIERLTDLLNNRPEINC